MALSNGLRVAINIKLKGQNRMLKLDIDSKMKSLTASIKLEGEDDILDIEIKRYQLEMIDGKYMLTIEGLHASKPWIETIARSFVEGKSYEIPSEYARLLKTFI